MGNRLDWTWLQKRVARKMTLYPNYLLVSSKRYRQEQGSLPQPSELERVTVAWDDQNPDLNFMSRTQDPGFIGPDNPPAVYRFYKEPIEKQGDFRVKLDGWKQAIIDLNGGGREGEQRWEYLVDPKRATFNTTGWAQQAYLTMSGNELLGEFVGSWFRFVTLKPSDTVVGMTRETHPHFVHHFTCVTWKVVDGIGFTHRIDGTGTPRGQVLWYCVTNEGFAYIPARHVVRL